MKPGGGGQRSSLGGGDRNGEETVLTEAVSESDRATKTAPVETLGGSAGRNASVAWRVGVHESVLGSGREGLGAMTSDTLHGSGALPRPEEG